MLLKLGGDASYDDFDTKLWDKWCKVLTMPEQLVYEFLVNAYDEGLETMDVNVLVKHCNISKAALWKALEHLDSYGLLDRMVIDD